MGLGLGFAFSVAGALLSYWFGLRRNTGRTAAPLVYLFLTVLLLGMIGAVTLVMGLFSGKIVNGLVSGLGVVIGFSIVFAGLMFGYLKFGDSN